MLKRVQRPLLAALAIFTATVFVSDLFTPVGLEVWVLYLPVILAAVLLNNRRFVVVVSATCTGLVILGAYFTPLIHKPQRVDVLNRSMGLTAIWLMTLAGTTMIRRSWQVAETMKSLQLAILHHEEMREALATSEERLRLAIAGAGMGTWDVDLRSGEANWSEIEFQLPGYQPTGHAAADWETWLASNYSDQLGQVLDKQRQARSHHSLRSAELQIRRQPTGEVAWLALYGRFVYDESGEAIRFAGVSFDVSQRKELEREVLEIAAREQRRIGEELHDSVAQEVTGLSLIANSLAQRLEITDPDNRIAHRLVTALGRVHDQVRALSHGLVPFHIDAGGLAAALRDLAERAAEQSGISIQVEAAESPDQADNATARQLLRIAQESVNNAIRHGNPQHIKLILDSTPDGLRLRIRDDGVGIPKRSERAEGMGIRIMRYRAGLIGGAFRIASGEGIGTVVTCTVPRRQDNGKEERGSEWSGVRELLSQASDCG